MSPTFFCISRLVWRRRLLAVLNTQVETGTMARVTRVSFQFSQNSQPIRPTMASESRTREVTTLVADSVTWVTLNATVATSRPLA